MKQQKDISQSYFIIRNKYYQRYDVTVPYLKVVEHTERWYKDRVIERDNGRCQVCGEPFDEVHHIQPKYLGGSNYPCNLICLCFWHHLLAPDNPPKLIPLEVKE